MQGATYLPGVNSAQWHPLSAGEFKSPRHLRESSRFLLEPRYFFNHFTSLPNALLCQLPFFNHYTIKYILVTFKVMADNNPQPNFDIIAAALHNPNIQIPRIRNLQQPVLDVLNEFRADLTRSETRSEARSTGSETKYGGARMITFGSKTRKDTPSIKKRFCCP